MTDSSIATPAAASHERLWRRFTRAQRLTRFAVYLAVVAAIVMAAQTLPWPADYLFQFP